MRIVAGALRGRRIEAPKGDATRPTTDRVREALFSSLSSMMGPDLGGGRVLDAFAGSGALGLEALSRGAARATFVEKEHKALAVLRSNVESLGLTGSATVLAGDSFTLARSARVAGGPFALLLLDAPYRLDPASIGELLESLVGHDLLEDGCVAVWEHAAGVAPIWPEGFSAGVHKRYGSTEVDIATYERGAGS